MGIARLSSPLAGVFAAVIACNSAVAQQPPAAVPAAAVPAAPAQTCDAIISGAGAPTITKAYDYRYAATPDADAAKAVHLGSVITIEGTAFEKLFTGACAKRPVVLFINGLPMTGLSPNPPTNPSGKSINFTLRRADSVRDAWVPVLGSPLTNSGKISVSVGFKDGFPLSATDSEAVKLRFNVVPPYWFFWAVLFMVMIGLFFYFSRNSNIIRDPSPVLDQTLGTYSLSRLQGAWWFFVIVGAYLFIGTITGDFSDTVNSTALILLGIGAGTVVGSAAIDAQKDTEASRAATDSAIADLQVKIDGLGNTIPVLEQNIKATKADDPGLAKLKADLATQTSMHSRLNSQLRKLRGQSEGIFTDILSDANGISFHRFQIAVWTLVLSIIFIIEVYQNLAMPEFNTTLMGMMGLSAGTYLGLKIPEPTTPSKPPLGT